MSTLVLTFALPEIHHELFIADWINAGFEGFLQEEQQLKAYLPEEKWHAALRADLVTWLSSAGYSTDFNLETLAPQNWNAQWEQSIEPIVVPPFLIKPTWAAVPPEHADLTLLQIDPKMSFGTGHHESTRLVLQFLAQYLQPNDFVLDAGTGTGVLAIAAVQVGAARVIAFDNDPWVQENVTENVQLNKVQKHIVLRIGTMADIPETNFDLILANINRNVLMALWPDFAQKLAPSGTLILAGLLQTDRDAMVKRGEAAGFTLHDEATEGTWWSGVWRKTAKAP